MSFRVALFKNPGEESTYDFKRVPYMTPYDAFTIPPGGGDFSGIRSADSWRLIFLDIDGVLNSHKTLVALGGISNPSFSKDENGKRKAEIRDAKYQDSLVVKLLNKLCAATGAYIVLSSTWRIGYSCEDIQSLFVSMGINPHYLLGKTDHEGKHRGDEIERFLTKIAESKEVREGMIKDQLLLPEFDAVKEVKIESYVILDDDSDMLESQLGNFVHINGVEGLSLTETIKAGQILTKSESFGLHNMFKAKDDNFTWN